MVMKPVQLVVSHYQENMDWLSMMPSDIDVVIYNKFFAEGYQLPNIGRETHTYLHHILQNWENLPDTIAFVQGNPHEHTKDLAGKLLNIPDDIHFAILSDWIPADNGTGSPWGSDIPFDQWYRRGFQEEEGLGRYVFGTGAQFVVSRSAIQQRPRAFYERLYSMISDPDQTVEFGYAMERFWYYVFNLDYSKHPRCSDEPNSSAPDFAISVSGVQSDVGRIFNSPSPSIGIVVGTYGSLPYVHLHLETRKRLYPEIPLLVHDDCSDESPALEKLCTQYDADFYRTLARHGHQEGDLSACIAGITYCYDKGLDLAVKLSRTYIPLNNFVPELQKLAWKTQYMTFSNRCASCNYLFDTCAVAWHARSYVEHGLLFEMMEGLRQRSVAWGYVEQYLHNIARSGADNHACTANKTFRHSEGQDEGYGVWDWMGQDCRQRKPNQLWHRSNDPVDYYQLSSMYGLPYTLVDFQKIAQ